MRLDDFVSGILGSDRSATMLLGPAWQSWDAPMPFNWRTVSVAFASADKVILHWLDGMNRARMTLTRETAHGESGGPMLIGVTLDASRIDDSKPIVEGWTMGSFRPHDVATMLRGLLMRELNGNGPSASIPDESRKIDAPILRAGPKPERRMHGWRHPALLIGVAVGFFALGLLAGWLLLRQPAPPSTAASPVTAAPAADIQGSPSVQGNVGGTDPRSSRIAQELSRLDPRLVGDLSQILNLIERNEPIPEEIINRLPEGLREMLLPMLRPITVPPSARVPPSGTGLPPVLPPSDMSTATNIPRPAPLPPIGGGPSPDIPRDRFGVPLVPVPPGAEPQPMPSGR